MSHILLLDESTDAELVGSLGAQLSSIAKDGIRVVDGFILPVGFSLENGLSNEILRNFDRLKTDHAVLRPSYANPQENGSEVLRGVPRYDIIDAVRYLKSNSSRRGSNPALVIQKDLKAEVAGTIHSINPFTKNPHEVLIEAQLWMNETVLGGSEEADMIIVDKHSGATLQESEEIEEICLTPEQIHQLFVVARRCERRAGYPVSLDWAYDNGVLYILRGRRLDERRLKEYEYED